MANKPLQNKLTKAKPVTKPLTRKPTKASKPPSGKRKAKAKRTVQNRQRLAGVISGTVIHWYTNHASGLARVYKTQTGKGKLYCFILPTATKPGYYQAVYLPSHKATILGLYQFGGIANPVTVHKAITLARKNGYTT